MRDGPDDRGFRAPQEVTSIHHGVRISPLEGPSAVSFHITIGGGGQAAQKQAARPDIRSTGDGDYVQHP
jgi:hypothetical protein